MMFIIYFLIVHTITSVGTIIHLTDNLLKSRRSEFLTIVDTILRRISAGLFLSFFFVLKTPLFFFAAKFRLSSLFLFTLFFAPGFFLLPLFFASSFFLFSFSFEKFFFLL